MVLFILSSQFFIMIFDPPPKISIIKDKMIRYLHLFKNVHSSIKIEYNLNIMLGSESLIRTAQIFEVIFHYEIYMTMKCRPHSFLMEIGARDCCTNSWRHQKTVSQDDTFAQV